MFYISTFLEDMVCDCIADTITLRQNAPKRVMPITIQDCSLSQSSILLSVG